MRRLSQKAFMQGIPLVQPAQGIIDRIDERTELVGNFSRRQTHAAFVVGDLSGFVGSPFDPLQCKPHDQRGYGEAGHGHCQEERDNDRHHPAGDAGDHALERHASLRSREYLHGPGGGILPFDDGVGPFWTPRFIGQTRIRQMIEHGASRCEGRRNLSLRQFISRFVADDEPEIGDIPAQLHHIGRIQQNQLTRFIAGQGIFQDIEITALIILDQIAGTPQATDNGDQQRQDDRGFEKQQAADEPPFQRPRTPQFHAVSRRR